MNSVLLAKGHLLGDRGTDSEDEDKSRNGREKIRRRKVIVKITS